MMTPGSDAAPSLRPSLWQAMLQLRAGGTALPADTLLHSDAAGWMLHPRLDDGERAAFALYKPLLDVAGSQTAGRPWLLAQLGQSLDGCIATRSGDSNFVTGEASLQHLHRLRALCDAVLVGAGTVAADDPQLTTRRVSGPHPVRIALDPAARLDGRARLFQDDQAPSWWICDAAHSTQAEARLAEVNACARAKVLGVAGLSDPGSGPSQLLQALQQLGLRRVLVEGGGVTVSRLLAAGCLDRLHLVISPVLIGDGRPGLQLPPQHAVMSGCPRPAARVFALGADRLWDLDLRALNP